MKKNKTKISIIIPTYNDSKFISRAIESVMNQSFAHWEVIIIDDSSTDNTWQIISKFKKDPRFKLIKNRKNIGATKSINLGIKISEGKYIARLDGDDEWISKEKLSKQFKFMESNQAYGIVGSYAHAVSENGNLLFDISYPNSNLEINNIILRHNCFIHSSVLIRKKILDKVNCYDEKYRYAQDYDLFLKIGIISKLHLLPEYLVNYTINPNGVSIKKYRAQTNSTIEIIQKYKSYYPNYFSGYVMWRIRKHYPVWFRGALSRKIKKLFIY